MGMVKCIQKVVLTMGTGGVKKSIAEQSAADDRRKLRAIEKLVKYGLRGSEWQEAGLLNAIEKIIDGHDTSSDSIEKLMKEAKRY